VAAYAAHDRLHTAPAGTPPDAERDLLLDQAHAAWAADIAAGRHALLLAADTATVTELNARARTHRLAHGQVSAHGVPLREGTTAGVGDHLAARPTTSRQQHGAPCVGHQPTVPVANSRTAEEGPIPAGCAGSTAGCYPVTSVT
jgi:hypothetical protein